LRELKDEGFDYLPVDIYHSEERWTIKDGKLIGPLTQIRGVGPSAVQEILAARRQGTSLKPRLVKLLAKPTTKIDSLYPVKDTVAAFHPSLEAIGIVSKPRPIAMVEPNGTYQTVLVIGVAERVVPRDENEAIKVAQRGGVVKTGQTASLNLFVRDDTGEILCKIGFRDYDRLNGAHLAENTRAERTLYAIKGSVPKDFRMIWVDRIKYLGELDQLPQEKGDETLQEDKRQQDGGPGAIAGGSTENAQPGSVEVRTRKAPKSDRAKKKVQREPVKQGSRGAGLPKAKGRTRVHAKGKKAAQT
jgi:hypothetical protein